MSAGFDGGLVQRLSTYGMNFPKRTVIGIILMVALFAFEMFNFDTTRYALANLLGPVSFAGVGWAAILAVAFCAIDFAGLVRLFTPESDGEQPKEVWYLMGAWLLGATMNALMTWWAVSLTLLNHDFGNEVMSREQLLQIVPIFVAVLVWLTRILFIGALSVAGEHLLEFGTKAEPESRPLPKGQPVRESHAQNGRRPMPARPNGVPQRQPVFAGAREVPHTSSEVPAFLRDKGNAAETTQVMQPGLRKVVEDEPAATPRKRSKPNGRVRQRPPIPGSRSLNASARKRN